MQYTFVMPKPRSKSTPLDETLTKTIAERVVKIRIEKGMTQKDLSEISGLSRALLASMESGRTRLNDITIILLAKCLNVSTDELLGVSERTTNAYDLPNIQLMKRLKKIESLSPDLQRILIKTIDLFLMGAGIEVEKEE